MDIAIMNHMKGLLEMLEALKPDAAPLISFNLSY
jgi:hypothetical protein